MARQKTAQPRTPKKARHILSTTVREFYEANVIRSRRGHYSVRDGHRISVDPSGRAVLSGTGSDPIEWLVEIEHRIVACADREERSAQFVHDHTRLCRENGKLSWDGASAYKPHPALNVIVP
jgi:hypothetical protein|tara:strand:- start:426 stop:791 length:366 start_codon:yes stop_codon:yes gene_type:complete